MHKLDHVGWITKDIDAFEAFWCDILGFELVKDATLAPEMAEALFGTMGKEDVTIRRYVLEGFGTDIEIHYFPAPADRLRSDPKLFQIPGINHICLHTGGRGSREIFLRRLAVGSAAGGPVVQVHKYDNPGGWTNYFIRDFENNWIVTGKQI